MPTDLIYQIKPTDIMPLETFLTELTKCVDAGYEPWTKAFGVHTDRIRLNPNPAKVNARMPFCVITAVAHRLGGLRFPLPNWEQAARYIGLDPGVAKYIVEVTEFANPHDPVCRSLWEAIRQPIPRR